MGSTNFFSKLASVDPLAQALHLPGSNKYAQAEASQDAGTSAANGGPYSGKTATLAGANGNYAPGGPGSNEGWQQWAPTAPGGIFGAAQRISSAVGGTTPNPIGGSFFPNNPGQLKSTATTAPGYTAPPGINPYVAAARTATANYGGSSGQGLYGGQ